MATKKRKSTAKKTKGKRVATPEQKANLKKGRYKLLQKLKKEFNE